MDTKSLQKVSLAALKSVKKNRFDEGIASRLPEAFKKFWRELKWLDPAPVHYIPEQGKWKRNPETGEVSKVHNIPIPLIFPPEHHTMLWGGEGIVKGFIKRHPLRRRVPRFWVPVLKRSVVHSEVLGLYMPVIVTDRLLELVLKHNGFDFYLLETPACDLQSNLALKLKRKILLALSRGNCHPDNPKKKAEVLKKYEKHIVTEEEADWYGLTMKEASIKQLLLEKEDPKPFKIQYRMDLIERLKEANIEEVSELDSGKSTWMTKINPFSSTKSMSKSEN